MENKNSITITFLSIVIIGLVGYMFADKLIISKNNSVKESNVNIVTKEENNKVKNYLIKDVEGVYSFNAEILDAGVKENVPVNLYLYSDGTFKYSFIMVAGNYVVEENKIILHQLFAYNNQSIDMNLAKPLAKTIIINSDGTLTDNDPWTFGYGIITEDFVNSNKKSTLTKTNNVKDSDGIYSVLEQRNFNCPNYN